MNYGKGKLLFGHSMAGYYCSVGVDLVQCLSWFLERVVTLTSDLMIWLWLTANGDGNLLLRECWNTNSKFELGKGTCNSTDSTAEKYLLKCYFVYLTILTL